MGLGELVTRNRFVASLCGPVDKGCNVREVDASELTADYQYLAVLTDTAAACMIAVTFILSGSRYQGNPTKESKSAIL